MAIELVVEVLDHAPQDITPAELVVLIAIAERANARTRVAYPSKRTAPWSLAERCRLSPTGLRSALQRLAARGLEARVQISTDKADRPVYACRGRSTDYRLPNLKGDASSSPSGDGKATPARRQSDQKGDATASHGDVSSSPIRPNGDVSSSPRTSRGTSRERQAGESFVNHSRTARQSCGPPVDQKPVEPSRFCADHPEGTDRACRACGVARRLAATREAAYARDLAHWDKQMDAWHRWNREQPWCKHDRPGGSNRIPGTGVLACAQCDRDERSVA